MLEHAMHYKVLVDGEQYTVELSKDLEDGGYNVSVPRIKGCHTQGETIEEALEMARDAIRLCLKWEG